MMLLQNALGMSAMRVSQYRLAGLTLRCGQMALLTLSILRSIPARTLAYFLSKRTLRMVYEYLTVDTLAFD